MLLSVIIPVYNEEKTVSTMINRVKNSKIPIQKEIVVVDDKSNDNTLRVLNKIKGIKIIKHEKNQGKGSAIRTGLNQAKGDIIIIQDADLEYNPKEYSKLLKPILEGKTDVVYGSRFLGKKISSFKKINPAHHLGNKILTFLTNLLYGSRITDMETCYKVFKKSILKDMKLKAKRFDFEPEITAKILKKGYKIYEVPISFVPRSFNEGKKINMLDGIKAFGHLIKYKFIQ